MNFTLIALASSFFAATANILARTIMRGGLKSKDMLIVGFAIIAIVLVIFSPVFYYFQATKQAIFLLLTVCLIDTLANFFYFKTFEKTEASIATPLLSLAPGFTFLFGWFLLGDVVSRQSYLICIVIIMLIIVFTADFKNFINFKTATLFPALVASFLFGISAIPSKALLDTIHATNSPTLYMYRAIICGLFSFIFFRFRINKISVKQYGLIFVRSLFVITQWLLLYVALAAGNAGVTVTLGNITPIFVFILGVMFLKEKVEIRKIITATLVLVLSLVI